MSVLMIGLYLENLDWPKINWNCLGFDYVLKNIKNIDQKCRSCGIYNIFISGLVPTTRITEDAIEKVYELIKDVCKVERCFMFLMIT